MENNERAKREGGRGKSLVPSDRLDILMPMSFVKHHSYDRKAALEPPPDHSYTMHHPAGFKSLAVSLGLPKWLALTSCATLPVSPVVPPLASELLGRRQVTWRSTGCPIFSSLDLLLTSLGTSLSLSLHALRLLSIRKLSHHASLLQSPYADTIHVIYVAVPL